MPEALHSNLLEVSASETPQRRWAAIGRTYTEDVTFTDPDGDFVGWQALSDRTRQPVLRRKPVYARYGLSPR